MEKIGRELKNYFFARKGHCLYFYNPKDLREDLLEIFDSDFRFPLIIGETISGVRKYDNWDLNYLNSKTPNDEITVRNFFEGLDKLSYLGKGDLKNFNGYVVLGGIEKKCIEEAGKRLFNVSFNNLGENYFLNVDLGVLRDKESSNHDFVYSAESGMSLSKVQDIMRNYLGPNRKL